MAELVDQVVDGTRADWCAPRQVYVPTAEEIAAAAAAAEDEDDAR